MFLSGVKQWLLHKPMAATFIQPVGAIGFKMFSPAVCNNLTSNVWTLPDSFSSAHLHLHFPSHLYYMEMFMLE